jgi:chaperonin GroES
VLALRAGRRELSTECGRPVTAGTARIRSFYGPRMVRMGVRTIRPVRSRRDMKVRPLHDRIIVQRIEEGEQKIGGIIIPDTAKEKPQQGKVFAVGKGKVKEDNSRQPLDVKDGDTILFGKYSGQEIKIDGEEYLIMREDEILAVLDNK